jgi:hypothetical protein
LTIPLKKYNRLVNEYNEKYTLTPEQITENEIFKTKEEIKLLKTFPTESPSIIQLRLSIVKLPHTVISFSSFLSNKFNISITPDTNINIKV